MNSSKQRKRQNGTVTDNVEGIRHFVFVRFFFFIVSFEIRKMFRCRRKVRRYYSCDNFLRKSASKGEAPWRRERNHHLRRTLLIQWTATQTWFRWIVLIALDQNIPTSGWCPKGERERERERERKMFFSRYKRHDSIHLITKSTREK